MLSSQYALSKATNANVLVKPFQNYRLFERGDANRDGRLQLRELAELLNVEKNFLDICPKSLQQKELGDIFKHYDHDDSGVVEGPEFLAFVRDVLRIDQKPLSMFL